MGLEISGALDQARFRCYIRLSASIDFAPPALDACLAHQGNFKRASSPLVGPSGEVQYDLPHAQVSQYED